MLRSYSEISPVRVDWLWFPYIAYGKITVLQGNPGDGKSHVGIQLAAALSAKGFLPDGTKLPTEEHVIYQCAEDGLADTIKPRLIAAGANCRNVAFLDEEFLTLDDEKIREAIAIWMNKTAFDALRVSFINYMDSELDKQLQNETNVLSMIKQDDSTTRTMFEKCKDLNNRMKEL